MASSKTGAATLESRVGILEAQMQEVLAKPAFRKRTERGVCALGFEPSAECPKATLGRFQGGCHGDGCLREQRTYYQNYRARRKASDATKNGSKAASAVKVAAPRKRAEPKTTGGVKRAAASTKAQPAKKSVKRRSV